MYALRAFLFRDMNDRCLQVLDSGIYLYDQPNYMTLTWIGAKALEAMITRFRALTKSTRCFHKNICRCREYLMSLRNCCNDVIFGDSDDYVLVEYDVSISCTLSVKICRRCIQAPNKYGKLALKRCGRRFILRHARGCSVLSTLHHRMNDEFIYTHSPLPFR